MDQFGCMVSFLHNLEYEMSGHSFRNLLHVMLTMLSVGCVYASCVLLCVTFVMLSSSCSSIRQSLLDANNGTGGGQDVVVVHLPFAYGYRTQCMQGPGGSYSHNYNSTRYDVDFDTPNDRDDPVFAPIAGKAYIHDDPTSGFGRHVNVDLGDGTYINLSHLDAIFIEDGQDVALGQLIGFEGTTGNSTGDHLHMGRHRGEAYKDAGLGTSVEGLIVRVSDGAGTQDVLASKLICGLSGGKTYTSALSVPTWHPNGSLVMTPSRSTVYLLSGGQRRAFLSESVFWSLNYQFQNVALVSEDELDCYAIGDPIAESSSIRAAYKDGVLWLLVGTVNDPNRQRFEVQTTGWEGVLATWGVYLDLPEHADDPVAVGDVPQYPVSGTALFRDGSLIVGIYDSAVYLVSDGIAMPIINWDTFLLLDLVGQGVIEVEDEAIPAVMNRVGDCGLDVYCIDATDVATCGGPDEDVFTDTQGPGNTDPIVACGWQNISWQADNVAGDGQYLSSAVDAELWILETGNWWDSPADAQSGITTSLSSNVWACSGDVFTVNGRFLNFTDVPQVAGGEWWMCADPWDPRYWGTFQLNGSAVTLNDQLHVYSLDTDGNGEPSAPDEVGCTITVR